MDKIRKSKRRESLMNPYEVLGVDSNATDDEIKKAYKQLSKKYHSAVLFSMLFNTFIPSSYLPFCM